MSFWVRRLPLGTRQTSWKWQFKVFFDLLILTYRALSRSEPRLEVCLFKTHWCPWAGLGNLGNPWLKLSRRCAITSCCVRLYRGSRNSVVWLFSAILSLLYSLVFDDSDDLFSDTFRPCEGKVQCKSNQIFRKKTANSSLSTYTHRIFSPTIFTSF